ncbi:allergen Fel d 4-like [Hyaena hyaena]|uniref:allergen Fel d 4-like n=1 Tax=Hyaena hyaena TaxID=95912 RepID=UPI001921BED9|nr:allergen Fel d 4-like [Hyaena hyaena]
MWREDAGESDGVRFFVELISGAWYSILLASDAKEKIEEGGSMRVFIEYIEALDNSSLFFKFHMKENGKCTTQSLVSHKTEKDGVYSIEYDGYNLFTIDETDYKYVIFHLRNFDKTTPFQLMELYAREPDVSPKLKEKFVKYCQEYGIVKENVIDLTKVDRCSQARGSEVAQASSAE